MRETARFILYFRRQLAESTWSGGGKKVCGREHVAIQVAQVPSKANISDGPTRERFALLKELGAIEVEARLPSWALNV